MGVKARQDGVSSVKEPSTQVNLGPPCLSPSRCVEVLLRLKRRLPGGEKVENNWDSVLVLLNGGVSRQVDVQFWNVGGAGPQC